MIRMVPRTRLARRRTRLAKSRRLTKRRTRVASMRARARAA